MGLDRRSSVGVSKKKLPSHDPLQSLSTQPGSKWSSQRRRRKRVPTDRVARRPDSSRTTAVRGLPHAPLPSGLAPFLYIPTTEKPPRDAVAAPTSQVNLVAPINAAPAIDAAPPPFNSSVRQHSSRRRRSKFINHSLCSHFSTREKDLAFPLAHPPSRKFTLEFSLRHFHPYESTISLASMIPPPLRLIKAKEMDMRRTERGAEGC